MTSDEKLQLTVDRFANERADWKCEADGYETHIEKLTAERDALQLQLDIERQGAVEMAKVIQSLRRAILDLVQRGRMLRDCEDEHEAFDVGAREIPELQEMQRMFDETLARYSGQGAETPK